MRHWQSVIDLHTHTDASDGTYTPDDLVSAAVGIGLRALSITDHDTLDGHDAAVPAATASGLDLVCGIELSTRLALPGRPTEKTVHLLGYWPHGHPTAAFRAWLAELQASRRDRNRRLAVRLRELGLDVTLPEVERVGRSLTGRPHFARVLMQKGYVRSMEEAFHRYLGEDSPGYVQRDSPTTQEAIGRIDASGGLASLAHPVRLGLTQLDQEERAVSLLRDAGLHAIEVYHSDQTGADRGRYLTYADRYGLSVTGGSDFHGANKPQIDLGTGWHRNLTIPASVLDQLRRRL